jgi:uncharacterized RDD family membrane protein YckC
VNRASDASAPAPPRPAAATLATLPRRLGSLVYEGLLLTALVLVVGFVLVPLVSPAAGSMHALQVPTAAGRALSFAGIFGAAMAYCVWTWSAGRRSLPMKTWRLRLVTTDGASVTIGRAAARYVAGWLGPALAVGAFLVLRPTGFGAHAAWLVAFNFLWAFIDPDRQFLHDRLVGTRIVNDGARQ